MKPLISVIVPIYNVETFIKPCVQSIINQTYDNLQIILVDDGSTDRSGSICDEMAQIDDRIIVIHKTNGGLSDARNAGIEKATGDFIGFIDGDDYIDSKMYEKLNNAMIRNNAEIGMCGRFVVDEQGDVKKTMFTLDKETLYSGKEAVEHLLTYNSCDSAAWDKLYRSTLFENIRYPFGVMSEDYQITPKLMSLSNRVVHVGVPLYYYVQRKGSITKEKFTEKRIAVYEQVKLMTDYVYSIYPDLKESIAFFIGRHLISMQRYALKNKDKSMKKEMRLVQRRCSEEKVYVIRCNFFSFQQKVKYLIKNALLLIKTSTL